MKLWDESITEYILLSALKGFSEEKFVGNGPSAFVLMEDWLNTKNGQKNKNRINSEGVCKDENSVFNILFVTYPLKNTST